MRYNSWHSGYDVQLVPVGEEKIHMLDMLCGCEPKYVEYDEQNVTTHNSFIGEVLGIGFMHTVVQIEDC